MLRRCSRTRPSDCSPCAALGLALCLALLALSYLERAGPEPSACTGVATDEAAQDDPLRGLWMRYPTRGEGEPLRFWYFHGDGKGLYRYGVVGLANTHSFDYTASGAGERVDLQLRFRKRGDEHAIVAVIERDERGTWLVLPGDPYEPGARYRKVESDLDFAALARADQPAPASGLGDRIWIDYRNHATGGAEFHMYQLAKTAIDGRGVGWFHRGDFDNWSTESLTYRIDDDRLELFFDVREEPNTTAFRIVAGDGGRELVLDEDPRDYWATHRYRDGGRSFGSAAFEVVLGLEAAIAGPEHF